MNTRRFSICGKTIEANDPYLQTSLAQAYETAQRPRCLCMPGGVEMYVAHYQAFQIKRLPDSGPLHHPRCSAYAPEPGFSGLGGLLGEAVIEDEPGQAELRVNFPWTRLAGRKGTYALTDEVVSDVRPLAPSMSLRALMDYVFERAGLNRWHPAMSGKRSQRLVRQSLLAAARDIWIKGIPLNERLYVPEQFTPEHKSSIAQRRRQQLALLNPAADERPLALIIGEFKGCAPSGQGHKLWIKHMPDVPLLVNDAIWKRLQRVFAPLFEARAADTDVPLRLILTALIYAHREHTYAIDAASLMLTTAQWIPLQGVHELPLIQALIDQRREFIKPLCYDAKPNEAATFPNVLLLDAGDMPLPLYVQSPFLKIGARAAKERAVREGWCWLTERELPPLPNVVEGTIVAR